MQPRDRGTLARTRTPSSRSSRSTSPATACSSCRLRALGVGDQQLHRRRVSSKDAAIGVEQLLDPSAVERRDQHRARDGASSDLGALLVEQVELVEDDQPRRVAHADLLQHSSTARIATARPLLRRGRVDDVEDQVGDHGLLERRLERLDELMRQLADEADRVGEQVVAAVVLEARVVGSSVWKSRSPTPTPAPVIGVEQVDFPAFV